MNWNDPNWVGAIGQWVGALSSLLAIVIAVGIAIWSGGQSQMQSRQDRYNSARPVLIVSSKHGSNLYSIVTQQGLNSVPDRTSLTQTVAIKNAGSGPAFNVMSILHCPESIIQNGQRTFLNGHRSWAWTMSSLGINDNELCVHNIADFLFLEENTHIGSYSFLAPGHPDNPSIHEPTYICRVIVTYHDIFKRKHASVFDYDIDGNWTNVHILENIQYDLYDLKRLKPVVPKFSLLKLLKRASIPSR